jgi:UDP-N-acetylglucosamine:LPS N-acetylglucosamine transferase
LQQASQNKQEPATISLSDKLKHGLIQFLFHYPVLKNGWNDKAANHITFLGWSDLPGSFSGKNTIYTGNPAWDELLKKIKNDNASKRITYLSAPLHQFAPEWFVDQLNDSISFVAAHLPDYTFCIKIHPREDGQVYRKQFAHLSNIEIIEGHEDFKKYVDDSRLVITFISATLNYAVLSHVPVVLMNPEGWYKKMKDFIPADTVEIAENKNELFEKVSYYLSAEGQHSFEKTREIFIQKINTYSTGSAANRIKDIVLQA